ncbi:hypothetical protein P378_09050 [Desulforamulus profundi]|uniref:Uncharacterized protein n=1 Tax=Desulforamulus profundi TaxID=1383067 RepID=A0A2C6MG42_9FIRM|nr:hypothetical protein P378_09050 [Desulforamulus profundi]
MFNKFPIIENMHIHSLDGELREAPSWDGWATTIILPNITASSAMRSTTPLSIISMWTTSMASSRTKSPAGRAMPVTITGAKPAHETRALLWERGEFIWKTATG